MKPNSVALRALRSPRRKVVNTDNGLRVDDRGYWRKDAPHALGSIESEKLEHTFKLSYHQIERLADDAREIAAVWLFSTSTTDEFSNPDILAAMQATVNFIESLDTLAARHKLALAPVLQHLNPAWDDPTNWQFQRALELMRSLSDQKGPGATTLDEPRTVEAVDKLVVSWKQHTGLRPSKGQKRTTSPLRFYRALLPLLRVHQPRTLFVTAPAEFSKIELEAFSTAIDEGFIRGVDRWTKNEGK